MRLLIASSLTVTVGSRVSAKKKGKGKSKPKGCKKNQKKCGEKCIPQTACCTSRDCVYCYGEVCQPDGSCRCNPGTSQYNGVCGFKPECLPVPFIGGPGPSACCSGNAILGAQDGIQHWVCTPGTDKCLSDFDCTTGPLPGRCKGFMCPELFHKVTAEYGCP